MKIIKLLILSIFISNISNATEKAVGYFDWYATGIFHQMGDKAGYWTSEFSGSFESDKGDEGLFHKMSI